MRLAQERLHELGVPRDIEGTVASLEKEDLLQKIKNSEWMGSRKSKNKKLEVDLMTEKDLKMLEKIFDTATEVKDQEKPHCMFGKVIKKTRLGPAGDKQNHWRGQGEVGQTAHRIYHDLLKYEKTNAIQQ